MSEEFLPPPFRSDVEPDGDDGARVLPVGELDMSTVPILEDAMAQARGGGARTLVVDLRGLEFIDSTGLTLLTRWSLAAEHEGFSFALIAGGDRIQRLFELTRLITHFTFVDG